MGFLSKLFGGGDADDASSTDGPESDREENGRPTETGEPVEPPDTPLATVLYPFPIGLDAEEIRGLIEDAGLSVETLEAGSNGVFRAVIPGQTIVIDVNEQPFPQERMNRRLLPEGFPDDYSHISLAIEPGEETTADQTSESAGPDGMLETTDPWAETGELRLATKILRALVAKDALAVVLETAGGLAVPAQDFDESTRGADDLDKRPFLGWIDVRRDEAGDFLRTEGLAAFGLPEIFVSGDHDDESWRLQREQEALLFAAARMVHANSLLGTADAGTVDAGTEDAGTEDAGPDAEFEPIEAFHVPLGVEVGADPVENKKSDESDDEPTEITSYSVRRDERGLVLEAIGPSSLWATWEAAGNYGDRLAIDAYQALFRHGARTALQPELMGSLAVEHVDEMPDILYDVYRDEQTESTLLVTNGLGRVARTGEDGQLHRLELAVSPPDLHEQVLDILSSTATGVELSDDTFDPPDTVEFEAPLHGLQYFVLSKETSVRPSEDGPTIDIWRMVPLNPDEYRAIEDGDIEKWLAEHDGARGRRFSQRWQTVAQ